MACGDVARQTPLATEHAAEATVRDDGSSKG
jgi:hypothetical protein